MSDSSHPGRRLLGFIVGCSLLVANGCSTTIDRPFDVPEEKSAELDHGYGLLDALLQDESKVADILVIKSASEPLETLMERISRKAGKDLAALRALHGEPPAIDASSNGLPRIERDVRQRIRNTQTAALLLSGGGEFELRILLTQESAAGYAEALCRSLGAADPAPERAKAVAGMADGWSELGREIRGLLQARPVPASPAD